jgi:ligand-binding SRPBCC domain-containing protein
VSLGVLSSSCQSTRGHTSLTHEELFESVEVAADRDTVFAFFSDASNLEVLTPPQLRFRILTPEPIAMRAGALIDYTIRLRGFPVRWRTRIAGWTPPKGFVDEQLRGPYRTWIHTHRFVRTVRGTLIEDHVRYSLPLGPIGRLALPLVRRELRGIFAYRRAQVLELFGGVD